MKNILFITYYWPPLGGAGVPRAVKFAKFLKKEGWNPVILTTGKGSSHSIDLSFFTDTEDLDVIRTGHQDEIEEQVLDEKEITNKAKHNTQSKFQVFVDRLKNLVRINFLIPDSKIFWFPSAYKRALNIIEEYDIDIVLSTSPPYTVQLIALALKKKFDLPWIVDFRDPWTENVYYNSSYRNKITQKINSFLENMVLGDSDLIITIGEKLKNLLKSKTNTPVEVVHNGYDPEDYKGLHRCREKDFFRIGYYGSLNRYQVPTTFLELVQELEGANPDIYNRLKVVIAGNVTAEAKSLIHKVINRDKLIFMGYLSHDDFVKEIFREQLLLQLIHKQEKSELIIGSKIYEYFYTGNPILCLGNKESEGAELIEELNMGYSLGYDEKDRIRKYLVDMFSKWRGGKLRKEPEGILEFSREELTRQLINEIERNL